MSETPPHGAPLNGRDRTPELTSYVFLSPFSSLLSPHSYPFRDPFASLAFSSSRYEVVGYANSVVNVRSAIVTTTKMIVTGRVADDTDEMKMKNTSGNENENVDIDTANAIAR